MLNAGHTAVDGSNTQPLPLIGSIDTMAKNTEKSKRDKEAAQRIHCTAAASDATACYMCIRKKKGETRANR